MKAIKLTLDEAKNEFIKRGYIPKFKDYFNAHDTLNFQCPKHPNKSLKMNINNLKSGKHCPYCSKQGKPTIDEVREEFLKRSLVLLEEKYINARTPMKYQCPNHPEIETKIALYNLKSGYGCPICANNIRITLHTAQEEFIKRNLIPLFKEYINNETLLKYQCPNHLDKELYVTLGNLRRNKGCPYCFLDKHQSKGASKVERYLIDNNVVYEKEYKIKECKYKHCLKFDFAIFYNRKLTLIIEYDGQQHFEKRSIFGGGEKAYEMTKLRDKIKDQYCELNNISLIRIPYWEEANIEKILTDNLSKETA